MFRDAGGGKHLPSNSLISGFALNEIQVDGRTINCSDVRNYQDLNECLKEVKEVFVPDDVKITVPTGKSIVIGSGVTLASSRGYKSSPGAAIEYKEKSASAAIQMKSNSKLKGFRIRGPIRTDERLLVSRDIYKASSGIDVGPRSNINSTYLANESVNNVEIFNNEIYDWPYAGVYLGYNASNVRVYNNFIHDNRGAGYGYGVSVQAAVQTDINNVNYDTIEIKKNIFTFNRHDIASGGYSGQLYRALYNISFDGAISSSTSEPTAQRFDVHGCGQRSTCFFENGVAKSNGSDDREDGTDAGKYYYIVNNVFSLENTNKQRAILINGKPSADGSFLSTISSNWMSHSKEVAPTSSSSGSGRDYAIEVRDYRYVRPAQGSETCTTCNLQFITDDFASWNMVIRNSYLSN